MSDILKTHHFEKVPGEQAHRLVRVTPYVRLSQDGKTVFLKGGKVVYEDGTEVPTNARPDWLEGAIKAMNPAARAEVGFQLAGDVREETTGMTVKELEAALQAARQREAAAHAGNGSAEKHAAGNGAEQPKKAPSQMNKRELLAAIKEKWHFDGPADFTNKQLVELLEKGPEGGGDEAGVPAGTRPS